MRISWSKPRSMGDTFIPTDMNQAIDIKGLRFVLTSTACPEQYNSVSPDNEKV